MNRENDTTEKEERVITSNKAPSDWGELMGNPSRTTVILDRFIHCAEVIN